MKENVELLVADIRDDLKSIDRMKAEYDTFVAAADWENPSVYDKATIGYYLHNFYNACESIFRTIAAAFENQIDAVTWHWSILKRMKLELPTVRPPAISEELYRILDDFRAFRHVFRNAYSFELDWAKERLVAEKLDGAVAQMRTELERFIAALRRE
jgi:hypothetical protein